jgi:hypothetical protein
MMKLKPEILAHPNIPKPLHGISPRTIMGTARWNETRQDVYAKYGYICIACGTPKKEVKGENKWLEAHEFYDINFKTGIVKILSIEPLCPYCHGFIHSGRLEAILDKGEIEKEKAVEIIEHGFQILSKAKLKCFPGTHIFAQTIGARTFNVRPYTVVDKIPWNSWRLIYEGDEYYSKFSSYDEWEKFYSFNKGGSMALQRKPTAARQPASARPPAPVTERPATSVVIPQNAKSKPVLIIGKSGTGKTRSIVGLNPKETFLVNVIGKDLPIKGWRKNYTPYTTGKGNMLISDDYATITSVLENLKNRKEIKYVVIDDFQYLMANEFMRRSYEKGYDKFTEIGRHAWDLLWLANTLGNGRIVFFLVHSDTNDLGEEKVKTIGKLLDEKICVEGMFTIVLNSVINKGTYNFATQNSGKNTTKSPEGMFESNLIPNDLGFVAKAIYKFDN